jgi:tetratricopeptide (TPR) repeat protein
MSYIQALQRLPEEWRLPMVEFADAIEVKLRNQLAVRRQDFDELRIAVRDLTRAQERTEERVEQLAVAQARTEERVEELAAAQARTEERVEQLAVAQARTEERVEELAAAQARTEERMGRLEEAVANLAAAQARTEERMGRLEEAVANLAAAQARTEERMGRLEEAVANLAAAQARTEKAVAALAEEQGRMRVDLAVLKGRSLEQQYATRANVYFGYWMRRVRVKLPQALDPDLEDRLEERLSLEELADLLRSDALVVGQPRRRPDVPELWLALEVSAVVDREDVQRARRRASLLRKAGYAAIPAVAGERLTGGAEAELATDPAVALLDGHALYWDETLAAV